MKAKLTANDLYLSFRIEEKINVGEHNEPDDFVLEIPGEITTFRGDGDDDIRVGKFSAFYVDIDSAHENGESAFCVFDAHSQGLLEYYEALFDSGGEEFSRQLSKMFMHEIFCSNVLILDMLEILPEFRGQNIGLFIMETLIQGFAKDVG